MQTDSLFLHFPHASAAEAVKLGKLVSMMAMLSAASVKHIPYYHHFTQQLALCPLPRLITPMQAAKLISQRCFPPPIELKYERVCHPFLLLHVNRYAGKSSLLGL
jgi:hypothetical protein